MVFLWPEYPGSDRNQNICFGESLTSADAQFFTLQQLTKAKLLFGYVEHTNREWSITATKLTSRFPLHFRWVPFSVGERQRDRWLATGDIKTIFDRLQKVTAAGKHLNIKPLMQLGFHLSYSKWLGKIPIRLVLTYPSYVSAASAFFGRFEHEKRNAYSNTGSLKQSGILVYWIGHQPRYERRFPRGHLCCCVAAACSSSLLDIQIWQRLPFPWRRLYFFSRGLIPDQG